MLIDRFLSDATEIAVKPLTDLVVSIFVPDALTLFTCSDIWSPKDQVVVVAQDRTLSGHWPAAQCMYTVSPIVSEVDVSEGSRRNRDNPDMRYTMGLFTQNKFGISDEATTLRSLFQMSCIDPLERDDYRLRKLDDQGRPVVNLQAFEDFCRKYPHLVLRLRDKLAY